MRVNLLGARFDVVDLDGAVARVAAMVQDGRPHQVITLNPELLYRAQGEPALLALVNRADLVTADGVGVVWAARMAGKHVPERVTGIDLLFRLVARAAREGWRVFLLGGEPGVAEEAAARLKQQHPQLIVAGTCHGYFQEEGGGQQGGTSGSNRGNENPSIISIKAGDNSDNQDNLFSRDKTEELREAKVVEMIRRARPHLLFVGMGAPKQEKFIARNLEKMNVPVAVGVGGSFDVLAGRVKRAPVWMQRLHLEWLGRVLRQPRRWRRILVLPRFAWRAFLEGIRNRGS